MHTPSTRPVSILWMATRCLSILLPTFFIGFSPAANERESEGSTALNPSTHNSEGTTLPSQLDQTALNRSGGSPSPPRLPGPTSPTASPPPQLPSRHRNKGKWENRGRHFEPGRRELSLSSPPPGCPPWQPALSPSLPAAPGGGGRRKGKKPEQPNPASGTVGASPSADAAPASPAPSPPHLARPRRPCRGRGGWGVGRWRRCSVCLCVCLSVRTASRARGLVGAGPREEGAAGRRLHGRRGVGARGGGAAGPHPEAAAADFRRRLFPDQNTHAHVLPVLSPRHGPHAAHASGSPASHVTHCSLFFLLHFFFPLLNESAEGVWVLMPPVPSQEIGFRIEQASSSSPLGATYILN